MNIIFRSCFLNFLICLFFLCPSLQYGQEGKNLDRVTKALEKIPSERRSLLTDFGGFGSSILVKNNPGRDAGPLTFVAAVPLNADFSVDTALSMMEKMKNADYPGNILVAFLGDESNVLPDDMGGLSHKGLRDLLSIAEMPENWVICYIDVDKTPEKLFLNHGISGYVASLDIIKPIIRVFKSHGIPWSFKVRHNEIYKLGLVDGPEALSIIWEEEIDGFVLSGDETSGKNVNTRLNDTVSPGKTFSPDDLADSLLDYAGFINISGIRTDRHYSQAVLPWGKVFFISSELTSALMLLTGSIFLFLFLVYFARHNTLLVFYTKIFFKFFWVFLIMLPLMVFSLKASGLLYTLLLRIFNKDIFYTQKILINYTGAALVVLLAALAFFLPSPVLNYVKLPKRENFYGVSAVIFITMGLFLAAFLDFSYVPVFLWSFLFIFLGALVSNTTIIFFSVIPVPLFALDVLINIFETRSGKISDLLTSPNLEKINSWWAAIITSLFFLPLILIIKRGIIILTRPKQSIKDIKLKRKKRFFYIPLSIAAVILIMIFQISVLKGKQPPDRRKLLAASENDLKLTLKSTPFQDSKIISVHLEAKKNPVRFDVCLESGNGEILLPLYAAPVPFERDDDGKRINFLFGENPPNPLVMEIVAPERFTGFLKAKSVYTSWDPAIDPGNEPNTSDYVFTLTASAELGL